MTPSRRTAGASCSTAPPYKGKVTAYDYAIYIADAAVYLMATKPELGITNPYALDETQFAAAVDLLKAQRANITTYWGTRPARDRRVHQRRHGRRHDLAVPGQRAQGAPSVPIKAIKPKEGTTGWSDTWMISSKAKHPNCMYKWMDYIISPEANATATVWFGEAPVSHEACAEAEKQSAGHCDLFHATDEDYFKDVWYWNTPTKDVPRRARAHLHGLLGVDQGLDRDQGLGRPAEPSSNPTPAAAGAWSRRRDSIRPIDRPAASDPIARAASLRRRLAAAAVSPSACPARGCCWPPRWAGWSSPTSARSP